MELSTLLPLATALGLALLHSLWIGAVLYVLVRAVLPLLGRPAARHHLAYGALLATFAGFVYAFYYVYDPNPICENLLTTGLASGGLSLAQLTGNGTGLMEMIRSQLPAFAPWLSAIYVFGLIPAVILLLRDQRRVHDLRTSGLTDIPAGWASRLDEDLASHPATRRLRCYLSGRAGEVMTLGFWSPVIVFPVALVNELSPEMARTILLHEIAHLRHYDHWLNYPQQFLRTFFFFHPAVHGLCRLIDREREHRCDDWVAARCDDRRTYATALVTVARSSHIPANKLVMSATKTPFSDRIQRLFLGEDRRQEGKFAFFTLLLLLLGMGHLGYNSLGADAGAVNCLEEQGKTSASTTSEPDAKDKLLAYQQGKLKRSANEPWVVTEPEANPPCTTRLTVEDLPYIAAPEPPASTHPRAMESYERALRKYDDILQESQHDKDGSPTRAETALMLKKKVTTTIQLPCPKRVILPLPESSFSTKIELIGARAAAKANLNTGRISGVISTEEKADLLGKKLAYFIDGKRTNVNDLSLLDQSAIASIEVVKDFGKLKALGVPGCYDGALIIASKIGEKVAEDLHHKMDKKVTG